MIRRMELKDLAEIMIIEEDSFSKPWKKEDFIHEIVENDLARCYVLEEDEKIIGYAMMWLLFENGDITNIAVCKDYRHQGYGQKLLSKLIECAKENKLEYLFLEVRISNLPAISLYEKMGFETVNTRKGYYDDGEDALVMIKDVGGLYEEDFSD